MVRRSDVLRASFVERDARLLGLAGVFSVELVAIIPQVAKASDAGGERTEPLDLRDDDGEGCEDRN